MTEQDVGAAFDAVQSFLLRHYGSHERPAVLHALFCSDIVVAPDGTELEVDVDDVDFGVLVADVWTGRNEKMGNNISPQEWVELFDACAWPLGGDGGRADAPTMPLTAYRTGHPDGMSWTTSIESALHFRAMRPHDTTYQCTVSDEYEVLAVFHDRKEAEVVLRPSGAWRSTVQTYD